MSPVRAGAVYWNERSVNSDRLLKECSTGGYQPDLEAGEEIGEICRGSHLYVGSQGFQGPVARKWQTLEKIMTTLRRMVKMVQTLALLISQMVDMRRLPSRWMCNSTRERGCKGWNDFFAFLLLWINHPGSLCPLGSPKLGLWIVGHPPPLCCWHLPSPAISWDFILHNSYLAQLLSCTIFILHNFFILDFSSCIICQTWNISHQGQK